MIRQMLTTAVVGMVMAGAAYAGPLDRSAIPAQAQWVIHMDCQELNSNSNVQFIREQLAGEQKVIDKANRIHDKVGLDIRDGFKSVTFYGTTMQPGEGVAIVEAVVDRNKLLDMVAQAQEYEVMEYGVHEIHSWLHQCPRQGDRVMFGAFHDNDRILFAHDEATAMLALDVLDGRRDALADVEGGLAGSIPGRTILYAEATGLDQAAHLAVRSPLLQSARHMVMTVSQDDEFVYGQMVLTVGNEGEGAVQQAKMWLESMRTMALLHVDSMPEASRFVGEFLAAIRIEAEGNMLAVTMRLSNADVFRKIQDAMRQGISLPAELKL